MTAVVLLTQAYPQLCGDVHRVVYVLCAWREKGVAMKLIMAIIRPEKLSAVQANVAEQRIRNSKALLRRRARVLQRLPPVATAR